MELQILQKLVKQRKESAEIYKSQNRADMAEVELYQVSIIEAYLPGQMSKKELQVIVKEIVDQVGQHA